MSSTIISTFQNLPPIEPWVAPRADDASLLGKPQSFAPNLPLDAVSDVQRSFYAYFERQASALAGLLSDGAIESFSNDVTEKFQTIMSRAFDDLPVRPDKTVEGKLFLDAMKSAGRQAAMALERLRVDAARAEIFASLGPVDTGPQIIERGPGKGITVIRSAPPIENLVLSGGGAKGIGYSAAFDQLEKSNWLSGLKHLAGSSAGALTAACLAMGLNAQQFEEVAADTLFRPGIIDSLRGSGDVPKLYGDVRMGFGLAPAVSSLKLMDRISATQAHVYLSQNWNTAAFQEKLHDLHLELGDEAVQRLRALAQEPALDRDRTGRMVTFSDLALLHRLEPAKFKLLTLTGWDQTNKRETYFSAATTPHFPIAHAARISMAFPVVFQPMKADPGDGLGERKFADGGIGSNKAVEVFKNPGAVFGVPISLDQRQREEINARTAVFTFDGNNEAYMTLHGKEPQPPHGVLNKIKSFFYRLVTGNPDYPGSDAADKHKVWDAGPNAMPVFHEGISTLSMSVSDEAKHKAHMQSAWRTLEYVDARTQQAYHTIVDSPAELKALDADKIPPATGYA